MNSDFKQNSRSTYRAKRKKTNIVLNSLIIIVLALIILVAYNIFASGSDENAVTKQETPKQEQKQAAPKEKKAEETKKKEKFSEDKAAKEEDEKQSEEATASEKADDSQAVVSDGGTSPNVVKTIENPTWKPVGTTQTGEHTAVYDQSSVDWQEMLKAVSYATGLDSGNMTVYWLGRDKTTTNASIATVASKDKLLKYNVYIKWVDGEGWMPTRVEELAEIQQ
ncbi:YrrS family protein [Neobacillus rhizophilus]|uniref:YrrS family protein n=1 Tax=Neobacillus rhizophilus TaxID=2833579 RepID=A0A942U6D3_9BACI|nr:YrrS family protein [Neobacillus rhizophilus]MBS4215560.1 YrrS family protein [Neobacillus rhizophilus]MBU8916544.1 YrrS family protein [Bacillus sp. FJAT-29953]